MNKYDVVIFGGGAAGSSCAYNCAKFGLNTLLIEKNSFLGGDITSSLVIPAMKTTENSINNDFYSTLCEELKKVNGSITYSDNNPGWLNPELTKIILDKLLLNAGVKIRFESKPVKIKKELSSYIVTICNDNTYTINNKILSECIETNNIVDATGDAKICKILGAKILDHENKFQPINLRFIMSGINIKEFSRWLLMLDKDRDVTTACMADDNIYLSTAYTWDSTKEWALKPVFMRGIADGIISDEDINYFQLFSVAGTPDSIAFNCPRILDINIDRTSAYIKGRESIMRLSLFCKKYFPGFKNAYISSIANSLGIRYSSCVKGQYVYTKNDLITGKKFENPVVVSNYPIDIHSSQKNNSVLQKVNQEYQLPIESLIVDKNLFVAGKCLSADFDAQAALRIIPSCFSMGEGLAKYIYKNSDKT